MEKIFYLSSTIREFWVKGYKKIFISDPYCYFKLINEGYLSAAKLLVAEYCRTDKHSMDRASVFIQNKYDKYIPILAGVLNELNNVKYSTTFWRKFFSQAFIRHLTVLHDFYSRTRMNLEPTVHSYNILSEDSYVVPESYEDQFSLIISNEFGQEQLFSLYINCFHPGTQQGKVVYNFEMRGDRNKEYVIGGALRRKLKELVAYARFTTLRFKFNRVLFVLLKWLTNLNHKNTVVAFLDVLFAERFSVKLLLDGKGKTTVIDSTFFQLEDCCVNLGKREALATIGLVEGMDDFDKFFFYSLKYLLPKLFVEKFDVLLEKNESYFARFPRLKYVVAEGWQSNTYTSFSLAFLKECKEVTHIYCEHNGFFHIYDGNVVEQKAELVDLYYTSGWCYVRGKAGNIVQGASLYNYDARCDIKNTKGYPILYITNSNEARMYQYGGFYATMEVNALKHMAFIKAFFDTLSSEVIRQIAVRDHPQDYRKKRLCYEKDFFCGENYNRANKAISNYQVGYRAKDQILGSGLVIIDSISTTYLECLFMNKPCIFFLNPAANYLNEVGETFFDRLIAAKICWTDPVDAARFVNEIHASVETWWSSDGVQAAISDFLNSNFGPLKRAFVFYKSLAENTD